MELDSLIESAAAGGASDLHLEAGMPAAMRIRGALRVSGKLVAPKTLAALARGLVGEEQWPCCWNGARLTCPKRFAASVARSFFCRPRAAWAWPSGCCRPLPATVEKFNLHPDLKKLVKNTNGLILISGPTGSGKSSTLAADDPGASTSPKRGTLSRWKAPSNTRSVRGAPTSGSARSA